VPTGVGELAEDVLHPERGADTVDVDVGTGDVGEAPISSTPSGTSSVWMSPGGSNA
jgi:hypothetical protein